ncbi:MAG TPA: hypothetical protein VK974_00825 [Methylophilaceae bacterium]|nr:hypothetical protein [Methylophilaceae bacterium]
MAKLDDFIEVMANHIGKANGIRGEDLAEKLDIHPRILRNLTGLAIEKGISVCGQPNTGYYIAMNAKEVEETCQFHRSRAMHELVKESRLRKVSLADLLGQMKLSS